MVKLAKLGEFELELIKKHIKEYGEFFRDREKEIIENDVKSSFSFVCGIDIAEEQDDQELDDYYMQFQNERFGIAFMVESSPINFDVLFLSREYGSDKWNIHLNEKSISEFNDFKKALKSFKKRSKLLVKKYNLIENCKRFLCYKN